MAYSTWLAVANRAVSTYGPTAGLPVVEGDGASVRFLWNPALHTDPARRVTLTVEWAPEAAPTDWREQASVGLPGGTAARPPGKFGIGIARLRVPGPGFVRARLDVTGGSVRFGLEGERLTLPPPG